MATNNSIEGRRQLDIENPNTWPAVELESMRNTLLASAEVLYKELDCPGTEHELACELQCYMMRVLYKQFASFTAYHSCRPLNPDLYLQNGLLVTTEERLYQRAMEWFGCIPEWEAAFKSALNFSVGGHYVNEWYGGKVGLWFTRKPDYTSGSHLMTTMAGLLKASGEARLEEIRRLSKPTHVVCSLPHEWVLESKTEGTLMGVYASELLRAYINNNFYNRPYVSGSAIHVLDDIPPSQIMELRVFDNTPELPSTTPASDDKNENNNDICEPLR